MKKDKKDFEIKGLEYAREAKIALRLMDIYISSLAFLEECNKKSCPLDANINPFNPYWKAHSKLKKAIRVFEDGKNDE